MSAFGARYPTGDLSATPCPDCGLYPAKVWREGGIFHQRTECRCGRITVWVVCGHDAVADASDDRAALTGEFETPAEPRWRIVATPVAGPAPHLAWCAYSPERPGIGKHYADTQEAAVAKCEAALYRDGK